MLADQAFDEVISGFYEAAAGQREWVDALLPVQRALSAFLVHLHGVDIDQGSIAFSYDAGIAPAEANLDYIRKYHRIDPRSNLALELKPGEWCNCWDLFDDEFVANDPFYQEFLIPHGGRYASGTKLLQEGPVSVILGIHRGYGSPKLNAPEIAQCQRLARHMTAALQQHRIHISRTQVHSLGAEILNRIAMPIALLDDQRRIIHANEAAGKCFADSSALAVSDGRLYCRTRESDNAFIPLCETCN